MHLTDKKHCAKLTFNPFGANCFCHIQFMIKQEKSDPCSAVTGQDGASDTIMVSKHAASRLFFIFNFFLRRHELVSF
jgi:hypothetical protein